MERRHKGQSTETSGGRRDQSRPGLSCVGYGKRGSKYLKILVDNLHSISPSLVVYCHVITAKWGKKPSPKEFK